MKRFATFTFWFLVVVQYATAQWNNGYDIYNTSGGNVGIGTSTPISKFNVKGISTFDSSVAVSGVVTVSKDVNTYTGRSITLNNSINGVYGFVDVSNLGIELGTSDLSPIVFKTENAQMGVWWSNGNFRIGTTAPYYADNGSRLQVEGNTWVGGTMRISTSSFPSTGNYKLAVGGDIIAEKVRVKLLSSGWPDYVFHPQYELPSLKETELFIQANGHLPGVPSAATIEKEGLDLGEGQAILLKKVEELTLYVIELNKTVEKLKANKK